METTREVQADLWVADFMKQHEISVEHAIELMGNYYSHNNPATTWERQLKKNQSSLSTWIFRKEERISAFSS